MRFCKVRNVKSPQYGTSKSAGIDFFMPYFEPGQHDRQDLSTVKSYPDPELVILPHSDILIPSGIKMEIPEGFMLMGADKSGIATSRYASLAAGKKPKDDAFEGSLIVGAKIIDEDFQGEIHIHLINTSDHKIRIKPGMKIAQFILVPVCYAALEEVPENELFPTASERGAGCFGSTGSY